MVNSLLLVTVEAAGVDDFGRLRVFGLSSLQELPLLTPRFKCIRRCWLLMLVVIGCGGAVRAQDSAEGPLASVLVDVHRFAGEYCLSCHDSETQKGQLDFEGPLTTDFRLQPRVW